MNLQTLLFIGESVLVGLIYSRMVDGNHTERLPTIHLGPENNGTSLYNCVDQGIGGDADVFQSICYRDGRPSKGVVIRLEVDQIEEYKTSFPSTIEKIR